MKRVLLFAFALGCAVPGEVFTSDAGPLEPPTWSEGQPQWSWRELPGTSLAAMPSPLEGDGGYASARIDAWAGLTVDDRTGTVVLAASGGDWEYRGNEVLALRLADDVPSWTELRAPTPLPLTTVGQPYYLDGRPASRQVFWRSVFVERRGRLLLFGGDVGGGELRNVDAFDPARGDWDAAGTFPDIVLDGDGQELSVAEDPDTGDVYVFGAHQVHRWIESTNRWAVVATGLSQTCYGMGTAIDTRRHRVLLVGSSTAHAYTFSLDDYGFTDHGPIDLRGIEAGAGLVFVPGADEGDDVFLLRGSGAGPLVLAINAADLSVTELPTSGGEMIPPSLHGIFGRFRAVPRLGGAVFYPRHEGNVWFLRTAT